MRILHTADWHLGKNLEGISRLEEQEAFLRDFEQLVEEKEIDLLIIAGDVYDSYNPPARAEHLFYETLKRLCKNGERIILIVSGNHDNPERLVAANPLAREHGIIMVATPKSVVEQGSYGKHQVIASGEGFIELEIGQERAVILAMPYPSEKRLNEILYVHEEEEEKAKAYSDKLKQIFSHLEKNYREDTINLVVSHLFVTGATETGSERSIQLGGSFIVDPMIFPEKAQYVALGHIHKPMTIKGRGHAIRYAGSPLHYNKKEISFEKGCYIVDLEAKKEPIIAQEKFEVYKPIEVWKCKGIEEALIKCEENSEKECFVYLEIETDHYLSEEHMKKIKSIKKDILEILPKIKVQEEEIEAISLSEQSFLELFETFYKKERGVAPQQEVVECLLSIVEEEVQESETD
jgi:exonuclease SbcD